MANGISYEDYLRLFDGDYVAAAEFEESVLQTGLCDPDDDDPDDVRCRRILDGEALSDDELRLHWAWLATVLEAWQRDDSVLALEDEVSMLALDTWHTPPENQG